MPPKGTNDGMGLFATPFGGFILVASLFCLVEAVRRPLLEGASPFSPAALWVAAAPALVLLIFAHHAIRTLRRRGLPEDESHLPAHEPADQRREGSSR